MADIQPLGSERLEGLEKIKRIMEIAKYKEVSKTPTNENSSTHYDITFADGNKYGIVKEKAGYIIKKIVSESNTDYIEPMKNRRYFSSYSQALKKLNLMIKENNSLIGNDSELSLFGEQKKFVLKTPKPAAEETPAAEAPTLPEPELPTDEMPAPEAPADEMPAPEAPTDEMPAEDGGMDTGDMGEPSDNEPVSFKVIQKLTGKLTQKIRQFAAEQEMSSEDIKYVINMVLSSVDLASLSGEDKEEIMGKFESDEADDMLAGGDDKDGTDLTDDSEVEDIQNYMDVENDEDMVDAGAEKVEAYEEENNEQWQAAIAPALERMAVGYATNQAMDKVSDMFSSVSNNEGEFKENAVEKSLLDHLFSESKVDKVLSKYFELTDSEKKIVEQKKANRLSQTQQSIKKLSETIEQKLAAEKFVEENPNYKFIGKTNKKNLVFESKNKQTRISIEGILV